MSQQNVTFNSSLHPGQHGYDMAWSQHGARTVLREGGTILPQGRPPNHGGVMEAETAVFGTFPDRPTNDL